MTLQPVETLLAAALVLLLGHLLNRVIAPLARYNIPEPISGGLLVAVLLAIAEQLSDFSISFDNTLKPILMLSFFAAVGLSADLSLLGQGGKRLVMFVLVLIPFLFLQNALGLLAALGLDMHPLMGLVGGSITLIGGHGTGAAYAQTFAERLERVVRGAGDAGIQIVLTAQRLTGATARIAELLPRRAVLAAGRSC